MLTIALTFCFGFFIVKIGWNLSWYVLGGMKFENGLQTKQKNSLKDDQSC